MKIKSSATGWRVLLTVLHSAMHGMTAAARAKLWVQETLPTATRTYYGPVLQVLSAQSIVPDIIWIAAYFTTPPVIRVLLWLILRAVSWI